MQAGMEIYLCDLVEEKRKELLEFLGLKNDKEGNLDVLPVFVVPCLEKDK